MIILMIESKLKLSIFYSVQQTLVNMVCRGYYDNYVFISAKWGMCKDNI